MAKKYELTNISPSLQNKYKVGGTVIAEAATVPGLSLLIATTGFLIKGSDGITRELKLTEAQEEGVKQQAI
ncbi:MAG: hypothetical protein JWN37_493 [Candidatus Nomurabacteria bacterium]|nr:hypothetical protein [Candidatus Nomurabacteria bacterium]